MSLDVSGVFELAGDLEQAAAQVSAAVRPPVQAAAEDLKQAMKDDFTRSRHFRSTGSAVTYSTSYTSDGAEAHVGPRRGGSGSLAGIAYFGGANGGGGTVRDPQEAADEIAPAFERGVGDAIGRLIR